MNAAQFKDLLTSLGACSDAQDFAKGKSLKKVWETCERGDWLLWLAGKMADKPGWPTRQQVVLVACDCAETALKYVPKGEDRPRKCIEVVRAWAAGNASLDEVRDARRNAAAAAYAADADAAYDAAYAAAYAAYAAAYAAYAAYAAAYAADAAYAAYAAAHRKGLKQMANIVRKAIKIPTEKGKKAE